MPHLTGEGILDALDRGDVLDAVAAQGRRQDVEPLLEQGEVAGLVVGAVVEGGGSAVPG